MGFDSCKKQLLTIHNFLQSLDYFKFIITFEIL